MHNPGDVLRVVRTDTGTHTLLRRCLECGEEYEETSAHNSVTQYMENGPDAHSKRVYCDRCGLDLEPIRTEPHTFSYGTYTMTLSEDGEPIHTRYRDCHFCRYSDREEGPHADLDHNGSCDVCDGDLYRMSVTLPTDFPLALAPDGSVANVPGEIRNGSDCRIEIVSVELRCENGWTAVPYLTDMAFEKVDAKEIGVRLSDAESITAGSSVRLSLPASGWLVPSGASFPLELCPKVTAVSEPVSGARVASFVFTVRFSPDISE